MASQGNTISLKDKKTSLSATIEDCEMKDENKMKVQTQEMSRVLKEEKKEWYSRRGDFAFRPPKFRAPPKQELPQGCSFRGVQWLPGKPKR